MLNPITLFHKFCHICFYMVHLTCLSNDNKISNRGPIPSQFTIILLRMFRQLKYDI